VAIESTAAPIRDNQGEITGVIIVFRDVSEERKLRNQLVHQARHDALTGLANRRVFEQQLEELLVPPRDNGVVHAVLFLDLDQFKVVNDTCGHVAGDALLQQLTGLLREKMRVTDVLARLGGDEFGVILRNCSMEQALKIAAVLLDTVREFRFSWEGKSFELGVSIGLVIVDELSESVASVMSAADVACYAAKDGGRNRYHVYESSDEELALRHGEMQWVTLITKALEEDRFALYLQPIQPITGRDSDEHYEILIRMLDEQRQIIPPGAFLPAAERYGLMGSVDRWVIRKVFKLLADQLAQGGDKLDATFAINLSGLSIGDSGFLVYIKQMFEEYRVPPEMIIFEITETAAVANLTTASQFIKELLVTGCKFALDDFGSGLSSFSYLKNLPVDYLKIDGVFVRDMVDDAIDYAMVEAINRIGQVMGIKTIAEFVESEAILNCLVAIEVDYAQGYHIGKPLPIEEVFGKDQRWQVAQK
jgi:diguanylate cyclase (GGDEF)-like protein